MLNENMTDSMKGSLIQLSHMNDFYLDGNDFGDFNLGFYMIYMV